MTSNAMFVYTFRGLSNNDVHDCDRIYTNFETAMKVACQIIEECNTKNNIYKPVEPGMLPDILDDYRVFYPIYTSILGDKIGIISTQCVVD